MALMGDDILGDATVAGDPKDQFGLTNRPVLLNVTPNAHMLGSDVPITLNGYNFTPNSVVYFAGHALTTVFVSKTQLTATILAAYYPAVGWYLLRVQDPTRGNSNWQIFRGNVHPGPTQYTIAFDTGAYVLTGSNFNFRAATHLIQFAQGNYTITGNDFDMVGGRTIKFDTGVYTLTGNDFEITQATILPQPEFTAPLGSPALQAGMDTVDYQVGPVTIPGNITRWSDGNFRIANPGDGVSVFGDQFTNDLTFLARGSDGVDHACPVLGSVDTADNMAMVQLSASLPANDMYMVWPQNSIGTAEPFVVGRAEARWLNSPTTGRNAVEIGGTVNIYGINLSNGGSPQKSWVWLYPVGGGTGQYVDATGANVSVLPDRVQFTCPSLSAQDYYVYVHNGHGGSYGWSLCGEVLTVDTLPGFGLDYNHNTTQNLAAPAGGGASDQSKFSTAITNIGNNGPATITLQAGTYRLDSSLTFVGGFGRAIKLKGQGVDVTFIKPTAGFADATFLNGFSQGMLEDMTIDTTGFTFSQAALQSLRTNNCKLILPTSGIDLTANHPYGVLRNTTLTGTIFSFGGVGGVIDNVDILMQDGGSEAPAIGLPSGNRWSITNCTCQDTVINGTQQQRGNGKFVDFGFNSYLNYVADNVTTKLSPLNADVNANSGEQILSDGELEGAGGTTVTAFAVSSSGAVVTFASTAGMSTFATMFVIAGKGLGQWGRVVSKDATHLTLDRPLRVALDGTSSCIVRTAISECYIGRNTLNGNNQLSTASAGVEFFTASAANVLDSNIITDTRFGTASTGQAYYNLHTGNTLTHMQQGGNHGGEPALGNIYRGYTASQISTYDWEQGRTPLGTMLDGSAFTDATTGLIDGGTGSGDLALLNTTFSLGTGTFAGSVAKNTGYTVSLYGTSAFTGFQS